ncbi:MAG: hypothetical protein HY939_03795, partial [Gammaproteobacteria bacterium]|nr:hypothetical protein [Gammaproteobacteria bacterium]
MTIILLEKLLSSKNLAPDIFEPTASSSVNLAYDFSVHARKAYRDIYAIPYPGHTNSSFNIARMSHGVHHTCRTAVLAVVLANLYLRHGGKAAGSLRREQIKLLMIAMLYHDAGREADGIDYWDQDSASLLYFYLMKTMHVRYDVAKKYAEAIANKDWEGGKPYYYIRSGTPDQLVWEVNPNPTSSSMSVLAKIIHDADACDVFRNREAFDADKLIFHNEIATHDVNQAAFMDMAALVQQVRSLIYHQGDKTRKEKIKIKYENENVYEAIIADIETNPRYLFLKKLFNHGELLSDQALADPMLLTKRPTALEQCVKFMRTIMHPTGIVPEKKNVSSQRHTTQRIETFAEFEFRKTARPGGIEYRSTALGDENGIPYGPIGLFLLFPKDEGFPDKQFVKFSDVNLGSGVGKRIELRDLPPLSNFSAWRGYLQLKIRRLKGGRSRLSKSGHVALHSEVIFRYITSYDAIYFTQDPTYAGLTRYNKPANKSWASLYLQALYLQQCYAKKFGG